MILEYRTNRQTWNMVDGDISFCWDFVEDEIKKLKEKYSEDKLQIEIANIFKGKTKEAGFLTEKPHCKNFHICIERKWEEVKDIIIIVVHKGCGYEVFVFDESNNVRICYNDGMVIREFGD